MYYINIDENARELLELNLAKLVLELKSDLCVECVYFTTIKNFRRNGTNTLKITIVRNDSYVDSNWIEEKYSQKFNENKYFSFGNMQPIFRCDDVKNYSLMSYTPINATKCNDLFNSTILFDRTGKFIHGRTP